MLKEFKKRKKKIRAAVTSNFFFPAFLADCMDFIIA